MGLNWNEITVSIFGSLGVVGAVSYFAKEIIVHKLKASIDLENNNRLEIIKNDLNNNQMILAGVLSAQKEGYNISNQERLDAVKLYWNHYVDLISEYYNISNFDSVITIKEVNNLNTNPKAKEIFVSIVKELRTIKHFEIDSDLMAVKRVLPFITKNLWSHLGFLVGFLKRINFLYSKGIEEDNIKHWKTDTYILSILKISLTKEEFQTFDGEETNGINTVIEFMESKMLSEISLITNGKLGADYSFTHSLETIRENRILNGVHRTQSKI